MLTGDETSHSYSGFLARLDEEDRKEYLPRIPVQPVGYTDAEQLLMRMEGEPAPEDWQGGLDIVYKCVETCCICHSS